MVEVHQRELEAKQEEMDQEVEACNRVYQTRLAEMEAAQEAKWMDLVKLLEFEQINNFLSISLSHLISKLSNHITLRFKNMVNLVFRAGVSNSNPLKGRMQKCSESQR